MDFNISAQTAEYIAGSLGQNASVIAGFIDHMSFLVHMKQYQMHNTAQKTYSIVSSYLEHDLGAGVYKISNAVLNLKKSKALTLTRKYIFICGLAGCFLLVSFLLQNKASTYDKLDNLLSYGPTGKFLVIPSGLPKLKDNQIYINAVLKARVEDSGSIHKGSSQTAKAISGKQSHGFKEAAAPHKMKT